MTYWCVGVCGLVSWGEGGRAEGSVFQRNEAAQDVPVALVTKLFLFFREKKKKKKRKEECNIISSF